MQSGRIIYFACARTCIQETLDTFALINWSYVPFEGYSPSATKKFPQIILIKRLLYCANLSIVMRSLAVFHYGRGMNLAESAAGI